MLEIIAHRGYSAVAPENTLPAFEAAIAAGAQAVELDVQFSADGVPVVMHDATLDRTTSGAGPVRGRTLARLKTLDAGSWFSPAFAGVSIPTLAEALRAVRGRLDRIYVEVKEEPAVGGLERILLLIRNEGLVDRCVMLSFGWENLDRLRAMADTITIGYLLDAEERFPDAVRRAADDGNAIVACDYRILLASPSLVAEAHGERVDLMAFTVDDPAEAATLVELGVDRITTDTVAELVRRP